MPQILTLTPNPALDVSARTAQVRPTSKLRCEAVERHPGGGGINVARLLHRLGADVRALYTAGGTTGQLLTELLLQEGVACEAVAIAGHTRESFTVQDDSTGAEFRFVLPGPELSAQDSQALLARVRSCEPAPQFLVASGSLPPGCHSGWYAQVVREAAGRGMRVVVDTSGEALKAALQAGVYLAKPSVRELRELVGQPLPEGADVLAAAQTLVLAGQAQVMVVSMGEAGAYLVTQEIQCFAEPLPLQVRSAVGAGDSLVAGMVWALCCGMEPEQAFAWGVASASAALQCSGTGLPDRAQVQQMHARVRCRVV